MHGNAQVVVHDPLVDMTGRIHAAAVSYTHLYYTVPQRTVDAIAETRERSGRVVAVGTTSVRSLESAWNPETGAVDVYKRQLYRES